MKDLLMMLVVSGLLALYFAIDTILGVILRKDVYRRAWPLYDPLYRVAVRLSPYDIPPIYEGLDYD